MDIENEFIECYICTNDQSKEYVLKCECSLYFHKSCAFKWSVESIKNKDIEDIENDMDDDGNKESFLKGYNHDINYKCPQCKNIFIMITNKYLKILFIIIYNLDWRNYIVSYCLTLIFTYIRYYLKIGMDTGGSFWYFVLCQILYSAVYPMIVYSLLRKIILEYLLKISKKYINIKKFKFMN